jgi:hypothetical protein
MQHLFFCFSSITGLNSFTTGIILSSYIFKIVNLLLLLLNTSKEEDDVIIFFIIILFYLIITLFIIIMNTIDKIFIINLDKDIERLKQSYEQLNYYNIKNYERYPAIYGANLSKNKLNYYSTGIGKIIGSKSMIGCGILHINIWKNMIKEK